VWPAGVTGSLTHCAGYRAAAVSRSALAVGIDAEPHGPLPGRVLEFVATPGERRALRRVAAARPGVHFDRLLFSAKESVYKAWYPLTGRNLGFRDAEIVFRPDGTFHARLLVAGHRAGAVFVDGFAGRWVVDGGLLATAIAVPGTRTTDPERYPQGDLC
jgi:4'-phosphopantetheinyl transferase EntD